MKESGRTSSAFGGTDENHEAHEDSLGANIFYCKVPRPLLWAGSRSVHVKITITGIPVCQSYDVT